RALPIHLISVTAVKNDRQDWITDRLVVGPLANNRLRAQDPCHHSETKQESEHDCQGSSSFRFCLVLLMRHVYCQLYTCMLVSLLCGRGLVEFRLIFRAARVLVFGNPCVDAGAFLRRRSNPQVAFERSETFFHAEEAQPGFSFGRVVVES